MTTRILKTDADRIGWVRFIEAQPLPVTVSLLKGAKRSNPQNKTAAMWYGQISAETGQTQAEVKAECKLRYGLPIMERDKPEWVEKWSPLYGPLLYHLRLRMFEAIPLTSLLTTRAMGEYLDAIQKEYRAQGIPLVDPEAIKYAQWQT